ncbi:MAG: asparagine synthase (glutamine-hydrolyzing) [Elusimicrobiota bacterium]|jgi:asparagine synthase (glutamine-hydrolysing)
MCGICGIVNKDGTAADEGLLRSMTNVISHRGPDEQTAQTWGPAGFGFARLAIIDLSGGHQPMTNEDGRLWLVFNGEIYNFQALREQLQKTGKHTFKTRSDTEVILHLYEEYGEQCVEHLRGMFAFAIWDTREQSLFMARDRFGKKPLVYADLGNQFLFASELKALLQHPAVSKDIDYSAIDLYLTYQYIPSPKTVFRQIQKLPPAHTLRWQNGKTSIRRYWEPRFTPKTTLRFPDAQIALKEKLSEATKLRMIADVPLGAFLSGGVDSSIVVSLMSRLSAQPIKTFSIGFEEEGYSELPFARQVAEHCHTDHHEFIVNPYSIDVLPKLAWHYGEPYADSSALPSYFLSKMARRYVTVALNGDGGDENFGGYLRYQAMAFARRWQHVPAPLRQALSRATACLPNGHPPLAWGHRIKRLFYLSTLEPDQIYLNAICYFKENQKESLYTPLMKDARKAANAPAYLLDTLKRASGLEGVDPYLLTDLMTYLPECLMVKMDIATMANSLETRSPFLDHELTELAGSFPPAWKLHGLTGGKYILRKTFESDLPSGLFNRRKQGFVIPMSHWFRKDLGPFLHDTLLSKRTANRGLFEQAAVQQLLDENASGQIDHSYRLWALLMLEMWFQVYIDSPGASPP